MKLMNRVAGLFRRTNDIPKLSPYTVEHEKLDEYVLGDMRDSSKRFREALERPVEIEKLDENGNVVSTEGYEPVMDLRSDLFMAHHVGSDEVSMMDREEIRPSSQLNADIMRAFTNHEDFLKTRPMTRRDEIASTLSTIAAQETLDEELKTTLREQAELANDAATEEEKIRRQQELLEELRQKAKDAHAAGDPIPGELRDIIKQAVLDKNAAGQKLEGIVDAMAQGGVGVACGEAAAKAAKAGKDLAEVYVSLPGVGVGAGQRIQPEHAIELAMKWRNAPELKKMAELIGRFERDFRHKRSNRVVGGMDEVIGVELGNDVKRLLPMEYLGLVHPGLKRRFYRDFANKQLLQYEMVGHAEAGKGPVIICIDASGSMSGSRNEWARATALAVCSICHREKRPVYCIEFATVVTGEWEFEVKGGIDPELATDFAMSFNGGGTDITAALHRAKQIFETKPNFKTADVLVITDGSDNIGEDDLQLKAYFESRGVRLQGVVIGMDATPYTDTVCHDAVAVYDLAAPSGATDRIVQGLT